METFTLYVVAKPASAGVHLHDEDGPVSAFEKHGDAVAKAKSLGDPWRVIQVAARFQTDLSYLFNPPARLQNAVSLVEEGYVS